ncbi:hypothetical protein DAI22_12g196301 [Oryza sativa Japonica Group]|nr:hypothetical protein DAI22_12g196301 [Oryza sativa Japonica Group]
MLFKRLDNLTNDYPLRCGWRKVDSLGGHAIFLGSQCAKFVRSSQCVGGVQADCIYFMHRTFDNPSRVYWGPCVDPLGESGVYNMRNSEITPLLTCFQRP